jgi:class 3 adenylate cyclase
MRHPRLGRTPSSEHFSRHRRPSYAGRVVAIELPSGTVTFLFTDVEGSTKLLGELGPESYAQALAEHRVILRAALATHGGVEVDTQGDSFFCAAETSRRRREILVLGRSEPDAVTVAVRASGRLRLDRVRVRRCASGSR